MAIINPVVYGTGGLKAELVISFENGAVVTATNEDTVLQAMVVNNTAKIKLPKSGDWTITAALGDRTTVPEVVSVLEEYPITLRLDLTLSKYPATLALSVARNNLAAAKAGSNALFGGGKTSDNKQCSVVDVYDDTLTQSTAVDLTFTVDNSQIMAGEIDGYALFSTSSVVNAYDTSLVQSIPTELSQERTGFSTARAGNHALFAGGRKGSVSDTTVDAYDTTLTRSIITPLSQSGHTMVATFVKGTALIGAGLVGSSYSKIVNAYNQNLTRLIPEQTTNCRYSGIGVNVDKYALLAAGSNTATHRDADVYDEVLTKLTPITLATTHVAGASAHCNGYGIIASEYGVEAYTQTLTRTTPGNLSIARRELAGTSIGPYALFGGGQKGSVTDVVDVYVTQ